MVNVRSPWVFQDLVEELDRMTRDMGWAFGGTSSYPESVVSGLEIQNDEARLNLDLPGVEESDLELVLEDNLLKVVARREDSHREGEDVLLRERSFGEFSRAYRLPWTVREEDVEALFEKGVLHLRLKRAPEAAPRKIQITSK